MWFMLSLFAMLLLTVRRSTEKTVANNISSMAMPWLQQAIAMPFILATLFFAKFYWPSELPANFWQLMAILVILSSINLFCYFKALSIADVSYVAPLMSLYIIGNMFGAYLILKQVPTFLGFIGALFILLGVYIIADSKHKNNQNIQKNKTALILILGSVITSAITANIEVLMLRMSNPTSYNFYSSVLSIPFIIIVTILVLKMSKNYNDEYWVNIYIGTKKYFWPLLIIGLTYTANLLFTYQAKLISPNAAYVATIKSASILPIVIIGAIFFKEKISGRQWLGLAIILIGLAFLATN